MNEEHVSTNDRRSLVKVKITDGDLTQFENTTEVCFLWNCRLSKTVVKNFYSIPLFCDDNRSRIFERYQQVLIDLGESSVGTTTLKESLKHESFDVWNSCLVMEGNSTKSVWTNDAIKLTSLLLLFEELEPKEVEIDIANVNLYKSIVIICNRYNIRIIAARKRNQMSQFPTRRLFFQVLLRGLIYSLFNIFLGIRYHLLCKRPSKVLDQVSRAVVTYDEPGLRMDSAVRSRYLGDLPNLTLKEKIPLRYFAIHSSGTSMYPTKIYRNRYRNINSKRQENTLVTSISEFSSLSASISVFSAWIRAIYSNITLFNYLKHRNIHKWHFLIPITRADIFESIWGAHFVRNYGFHKLFTRMFSENKSISKWIFLFEGQDWERVFCQKTSSIPLIKTVGYVHVVLKKWDIRLTNFAYTNNDIAVFNDVDAEEIKVRFGRTIHTKNLEALRISNFVEFDRPSQNVAPRLLVLGSTDSSKSLRLSQEILDICRSLPYPLKCDIGWHPAIPLPRELKRHLSQNGFLLHTTQERLILADFVVCVNGTSPLEAILARKRTCTWLADGELSMGAEVLDQFVDIIQSNSEMISWLSKPNEFIGKPEELINKLGYSHSSLDNWRKLLLDDLNLIQAW